MKNIALLKGLHILLLIACWALLLVKGIQGRTLFGRLGRSPPKCPFSESSLRNWNEATPTTRTTITLDDLNPEAFRQLATSFFRRERLVPSVMGASESKLVFKQGIFRLSEEKEIPADNPYWTRVRLLQKYTLIYENKKREKLTDIKVLGASGDY